MRNNKNSKKTVKVFTIAAAVTLFGVGAALAIQTAGSANSADVQVTNTRAAAAATVEEQQAQARRITSQSTTAQATTEAATLETETQTETEATTETTTEAPATEPAPQETAAPAPVYTAPVTEAPATEAPAAPAPTPAPTEAPTPAPTEAPTPAPTQSEDDINHAQAQVNASTYAAYINEVYNLINQERVAAKADPVSYDASLTVMACHRAYENADKKFFGIEDGHHIRPNGQKASSICYYYGQYGSFGEVMGRYQNSPSEIVTGWHNSPAHYNCMTNGKYKRVGIGVAQDSDGNYYWVAHFMN